MQKRDGKTDETARICQKSWKAGRLTGCQVKDNVPPQPYIRNLTSRSRLPIFTATNSPPFETPATPPLTDGHRPATNHSGCIFHQRFQRFGYSLARHLLHRCSSTTHLFVCDPISGIVGIALVLQATPFFALAQLAACFTQLRFTLGAYGGIAH